MKLRLYRCDVCGKLMAVLSDSKTPTICCGKKMQEAEPNGAGKSGAEKHIPVMRADGTEILVRVSTTAHPMETDHYIEWIGIQTNQGFQFKELKSGDIAHACFSINTEERVEALYAFCNKHGLWVADGEDAK